MRFTAAGGLPQGYCYQSAWRFVPDCGAAYFGCLKARLLPLPSPQAYFQQGYPCTPEYAKYLR